MKKHWPWIFLLLIPLIPLWRAIFLGHAIGPFDHLRVMAPWNQISSKQPWDVLQADGALQFYVWRDLVFESWGRGAIPFWNPYELAGTPLLANSQSAAFYPPHILMGVLHIPTALAITLLAWFHLFLAGFGVSKLSQRFGANEVGAVVAGASFSLSAFMLSWTALSSVITTVSWIPWALFAIANIVLPNEDSRSLWRNVGGLAASVAMMVLGGHLQFVAYGFLAIAIFSVGLLVENRGRGAGPSILRVGLACVAGLLIAAPQLLPVLKFSEFSHRRNTPTAEGYAAYVGSAMKPFELATMGYALSLGDPRKGAGQDEAGWIYPSYWPSIAKPGGNFAESAIAFGPLILALIFLAPWRRKLAGMPTLAALGVFALLLAMGTIVNAALYYLVPGWSSTGSPGRIVVLVVMAACILGGVAISHLPKLPEKGLPRLLPLIVPLLATVVFLMTRGLVQMPENVERVIGPLPQQAIQGAIPGLMVAVVLAAVAIAMAYHLDRPLSKAIVLAVPIGIAVASGALTLTPTGEPLKTSTRIESSARVAFVNPGWELIVPPYYGVMAPNLAALSRIHDIAGYDSLLHRDTKKLLDDINGKDAAPPANGNMMLIKPTFDPQKLASAGVTEVWSRRPIPQMNQADAPIQDGAFRYKLDGPGRASLDGRPAKIASESAGRVELEVEGPGRLTLRDRNLPGWTVQVNERASPLGGDPWLETDVPAGKAKVVFSYSAPGYSTGFWAALVGILALGAVLLGVRRKPAAT